MSEGEQNAAVLLADVVGSTALYRSRGNAAALQEISMLLDRLNAIIAAAGGQFIHSRGDDVLCMFAEATAACSRPPKCWTSPPTASTSISASLGP